MSHYEFIEPYYFEKLSNQDLKDIGEYISKLSDSDYKLDEFDHYDGYEDKTYEKYRSCEVHYPDKSSILFRLGKKFFHTINKRFYRYDLRNNFEFQLIRYYKGGNYNWHCDYGVSQKKGIVRKLSMSIQLTPPEEYEGGELQVVDYGNHTIMIPGDLGTVIVFDSKLPHKVWPVTWGKRISLVGWANGPRLR